MKKPLKRKYIIILIAILLLIGIGEIIFFNSKPKENQYDVIWNRINNVYEGQIGNKPAHMLIYRKEDTLKAYYIFANDSMEYILNGTYNEKKKSFELYNEDKTISFKGLTVADTPDGDMLEGVFHSKNDGMDADFSLAHAYGLGDSENRDELYNFLGYDTKQVEQFTDKIIQAVQNDKVKELSNLISYPLPVSINENKLMINNRQEFIDHYDQIVTSSFKEAICNSFNRYLSGNYMGISLAYGKIYFSKETEDQELKINRISNNDDDYINSNTDDYVITPE